jgi:ATP-dependent Clp protease adaptor protein ClpS
LKENTSLSSTKKKGTEVMNLPSNDTNTDIGNLFGNPHNCILFNDDNHSQEEVASQIQKAISCDPDKAWGIMMAAHNTGSAIVITASKERCELASSVLEKIGLVTNVEEV